MYKIGITIGDPAGIGSEIIAKALTKHSFNDIIPIVIGNRDVINDGIRIANSNLELNEINNIDDIVLKPNVINFIEVYKAFDIKQLKYGQVQKESGVLAGKSIEKAIQLALDNQIDAVVTAPINKESFKLAGYPYPGHTEMFAALTNTKDYSMILAHGNLRVAHVTTHVSMRKAADLITKESVLKTIKVAYNACKELGIKEPKVGIAGFNAHAGEHGLFGDEEINSITPAVEAAKSLGINADGPISGDTIFIKALGNMYDCVVAMYHDQGHIPIKLLGFSMSQNGHWESVKGVNITFGLPIIRVSVDHGTAFGKAGKGTANENSLVNALDKAAVLIKNKKGDK